MPWKYAARLLAIRVHERVPDDAGGDHERAEQQSGDDREEAQLAIGEAARPYEAGTGRLWTG